MIYHLDPSHDGKGGAVRYINNLITDLLDNDIDITLIGAQITEQSFKHKRFNYIPVLKGSNIWWKYLLALLFKLPFLKLTDDTIIHIHRIEYALPFIIFYRNNPLIYTIHGGRLGTAKSEYSKFKYILIDNVYSLYEKLAFNRIDKIISVSEKTKKSFLEIHPCIINKISTIPVGVDTKQFNKTIDKKKVRAQYSINNEFVLLFVGVLGKIKNLQFLIDCFNSISTQIDTKLIIVGDGDEKSNLLNKVNELNLKGKVIFTGEINHGIVHELFSISDLFLLTSNSEGSPNVIKEALASGTPVVSTDVGDVGEVIINKNLGIVVKGYDEKEFADAILETIHHTKNNEILVSSECIKVADEFDIANVTREIIKIYNSF